MGSSTFPINAIGRTVEGEVDFVGEVVDRIERISELYGSLSLHCPNGYVSVDQIVEDRARWVDETVQFHLMSLDVVRFLEFTLAQSHQTSLVHVLKNLILDPLLQCDKIWTSLELGQSIAAGRDPTRLQSTGKSFECATPGSVSKSVFKTMAREHSVQTWNPSLAGDRRTVAETAEVELLAIFAGF